MCFYSLCQLKETDSFPTDPAPVKTACLLQSPRGHSGRTSLSLLGVKVSVPHWYWVGLLLWKIIISMNKGTKVCTNGCSCLSQQQQQHYKSKHLKTGWVRTKRQTTTRYCDLSICSMWGICIWAQSFIGLLALLQLHIGMSWSQSGNTQVRSFKTTKIKFKCSYSFLCI